MDIITLDGKEYDPYFILDVNKNDTDDHIKRSFRKKVKAYHPDKYKEREKKIKYEKYFKILSESYNYIKNKRQTALLKKESKRSDKKDKVVMKTEDLDNFNTNFKNIDPNEHGYGDNYTRMTNVDDYDSLDVTCYNQFEKRKFTQQEFNEIFEYNKTQQEIDMDKDKVITKSLIHKTSDGFFGYNTSDLGNCALVSSFNGLLITGDKFGKNGHGYWGNNYSDYQGAYKMPKNPNSKIIVSKNKNKNVDTTVTSEELSKYKLEYDNLITTATGGNFSQQETILYSNTYKDLLEKERADKDMVMTYINQYDQDTIKKALAGELDQSPKYISALHKYLK